MVCTMKKPKARHKLRTGQWNYSKYARHTTKHTMYKPYIGYVSMREWRKWFRSDCPGIKSMGKRRLA